MKRKDLILIAVILAVGLSLLMLRGVFNAPAGQRAPLLRVTIGGQAQADIPLDETRDLVFEQADGRRNVVHLFPGGFSMAESTCRNQDCVRQGEVTQSNLDDRPLYNQIVCLPNQVVLELIEAEESVPLTLQP